LGLYSVWFSACMLYSILAPFFPTEAEAHGMSPNTLGIMFSLYAWAGFCFSPFLGKLAQTFGRKKIYLLGVCSESLGILIFVLVIHTDGVMFILISFVGRICMGLGGSSILISTFAMIASLYHDSMEAKIGISESLGGIGLIIGPLVGGLIYAAAGYSGVFLIILVVFMVAGFSTFRLIPDYVADVEKVEKEKFTLSTLAFHRVSPIQSVLLDLVVVLFGMAGPVYFEPVLAPHLLEAGYGYILVSFVFALPMLGYIIAVRVQTLLPPDLDRRLVLVGGLGVEGLGLILIGPWEALGLPRSLLLTSVGLILLGCGSAWAYLPTLPHMIKSAQVQLQIKDKEKLSDSLSALMGTCHYLGEAIAPIFAGFFTSQMGFANASATFGWFIVLYMLFFLYMTKSYQMFQSCYFVAEDIKPLTEPQQDTPSAAKDSDGLYVKPLEQKQDAGNPFAVLPDDPS